MNKGDRVFFKTEIEKFYDEIVKNLINPSMMFRYYIDLLLNPEHTLEEIRLKQLHIITDIEGQDYTIDNKIVCREEYIILDNKDKMIEYISIIKNIKIKNLKWLIDIHTKCYNEILLELNDYEKQSNLDIRTK